jgi:hypothetical protein
MSDFCSDLRKKVWTILITIIISLFVLLPFSLCECGTPKNLGMLIGKLSDANLAMFGIDIAVIAILFALFQEKKLDNIAKDAFREQNISFVGNAILQLFAFLLSIVILTFKFPMMIIWMTLFFQIWALILVFDIIIELYCLHSAITPK